MFLYKKILLILITIIIATPSVSAAGSITTSLLQGKTLEEAVNILGEQFDALTGRVEKIETAQVNTQEDVTDLREKTESIQEQQKAENEALRQQLADQQKLIEQQSQQREIDKYCEDLALAGSQYLPTKQNIKDLYEAILQQNQGTFADDYAEHTENGAKILSEEDFRANWKEGKSSQQETLQKLKPHYDEYTKLCL